MAAAGTPEEPGQFRRTQTILGPVGIVLLFGLLGLAWWWHHRPGSQPTTRFRRVRAALVVAGLVILAAGSAGRLVTAFQPTPACSPPGGAPAARSGHFDVSLLAQDDGKPAQVDDEILLQALHLLIRLPPGLPRDATVPRTVARPLIGRGFVHAANATDFS